MAKVLVAYATKYGSTREVAEAVAKTLGERGAEVDVRPADDVRDVAGYSAVVLGAPLYYFRWHKHARRFLGRNRQALAGMPVAIFALGPFNNVPEEFEGAREQLDKALAKRTWLKPVAVTVFGGKFEASGLRFPDRNPGMRAIPDTDIRDWGAVADWVAALPEAFGTGPGVG